MEMATTSEHIQPSLPSQLVVLEGDQKAVVKIQFFYTPGVSSSLIQSP